MDELKHINKAHKAHIKAQLQVSLAEFLKVFKFFTIKNYYILVNILLKQYTSVLVLNFNFFNYLYFVLNFLFSVNK